MTMIIGLDIGGTKCAAVVSYEDGVIATRHAGSTPANGDDAGDFLTGLIVAACARAGASPGDAAALGVSYGGPVDAHGRPRTPPNLPNWCTFDLRAVLETSFGCPIAIVNDANATALAEQRWGAGRGCSNLIYLTLGTGIGAGLIVDGHLLSGRDGLAGEVGHMVLDPTGPPCACGKKGCLEALASGTAIGRRGREVFHEPAMTARDVVARAGSGDDAARDILRTAARWLGLGIANLLHVVNPERVLLGTMALADGGEFVRNVRASAAEFAWPSLFEGVDVEPAGLGPAAQDLAALAAAALPTTLMPGIVSETCLDYCS